MLGRTVPPGFVALLACLAAGLMVPALASALTYEVGATGDSDTQAACEADESTCTLRGAILAANASTAVADEIVFSADFDGGAGAAITLGGPLPEVTSPALIDGGLCSVSGSEVPCAAIKGVSGFASVTVKANESTVEHLKFEGGGVGIRVQALGGAGPGAEILENVFTGLGNAITSVSTIGGAGNLIEGNTIDVPENFNFGITISNGPNRVYGNAITGNGCCYTGVWLSGTASGNRIGGDTAASENVINGFNNGAITLIVPESTRNEIGRNRGEDGGPFINLGPESANGGIQPPAVTSALQSSVSGAAKPDALIRVFWAPAEGGGGIAGFVDKTVADSSGNWKIDGLTLPVGTFVTATQTVEGGTSELSEATATQADPAPPPPPPVCPSVGAAGCVPPPSLPDTTKPKVTIKKAPKAKSTATTAKFVFSANDSGSKFKCKLDNKAFANCTSPKTYKKLKPGKHTFKVKAADPAGNVSAVVTRTFTVLE